MPRWSTNTYFFNSKNKGCKRFEYLMKRLFFSFMEYKEKEENKSTTLEDPREVLLCSPSVGEFPTWEVVKNNPELLNCTTAIVKIPFHPNFLILFIDNTLISRTTNETIEQEILSHRKKSKKKLIAIFFFSYLTKLSVTDENCLEYESFVAEKGETLVIG